MSIALFAAGCSAPRTNAGAGQPPAVASASAGGAPDPADAGTPYRDAVDQDVLFVQACNGDDDAVCEEAMAWCIEGAAEDVTVRRACSSMAVRHCVMDPDHCHRMADLLSTRLAEAPPASRTKKDYEAGRADAFRFLACRLLREPAGGRCLPSDSFMMGEHVGPAPWRICERHREYCHEIPGWFEPPWAMPGMSLVIADARAEAVIARSRCRFGDEQNCVAEGLRYIAGDGVDADVPLGRALLEEGCNARDGWGCSSLADNYSASESREEQALAVALYRRACDVGSGAGCWKLGRMHLTGDRVDQSPKRAQALFKRACVLGYQAGCSYGAKLAE